MRRYVEAETPVTFQFIEFNHRRAARGVEAVRVKFTENGISAWLWMSAADIAANIEEFGASPELLKAAEHYKPTMGIHNE